MPSENPLEIQQHWPLPTNPQPIVIIGAGGIVRDAHLPAYQKAGLSVQGIFDIDTERSQATAQKFGIPIVYKSLAEAAAQDAVFDLAIPPTAIESTLAALPERAAVLIQKPLGIDLAGALAIRQACHDRRFTAAVNHQLRFSPCVLAARSLIDQGKIGQLHSLEVRITCYTPWHLWDFLFKEPRVEIQYHSIHYLDMIRSFLGEPKGVYCRTLKHPKMERLASVRTACILDYGDRMMVDVIVNHNHEFGSRHQESSIKWEGTEGAIYTKIGLLLDYPQGVPDVFEYCLKGKDLKEKDQPPIWKGVELEGSWFPDAFSGTMSNLQRYAAGEDSQLHTSVDDVCHTMALVEACYESDQNGSTKIPDLPFS